METTVKINPIRASSSQRREIKSSTEARHEAARATGHQTGCGTGSARTQTRTAARAVIRGRTQARAASPLAAHGNVRARAPAQRRPAADCELRCLHAFVACFANTFVSQTATHKTLAVFLTDYNFDDDHEDIETGNVIHFSTLNGNNTERHTKEH